jgi:hypothetical protein
MASVWRHCHKAVARFQDARDFIEKRGGPIDVFQNPRGRYSIEPIGLERNATVCFHLPEPAAVLQLRVDLNVGAPNGTASASVLRQFKMLTTTQVE